MDSLVNANLLTAACAINLPHIAAGRELQVLSTGEIGRTCTVSESIRVSKLDFLNRRGDCYAEGE